MKPVSTKLIFAEVACEVAFRCIYTLFNAAQRDMECFNLQLQMHNVWILIFEIILKWKDALNVKLKSSVGGSKSLLTSESLRLNRII